MPLIIPVMELVDNGIIQFLVHLLIGTLLRMDIRGTEFTGTVTAVYRLQIHD